MSLEWVSVFLVGVGLGLSVAILAILWRVWGTTHRTEQDGRERLEMLREQQERLAHLHEERQVLLDELERLREQKERLQWLREGRAHLLAELKRLRFLVEEEAERADRAAKRADRAEALAKPAPALSVAPPSAPHSAPAEQQPRFAVAGGRRNGHGR